MPAHTNTRLRVLALSLAGLLLSGTALAHQGHSNRGAWDACENKEQSDPCEWTDAGHSIYVGTCRSVSGALMCVRTQPIQPAAEPPGSGESVAPSDGT